MKNNKLLIILALVLALVMPLNVFASAAHIYRTEGQASNKEYVATLSVEVEPAFLQSMVAIKDLTDILSFKTHMLGENFGLDVLLKNESVVSLLAKADEKGILIGVPQLGELSFELPGGVGISSEYTKMVTEQLVNFDKNLKINLNDITDGHLIGDEVIDNWTKSIKYEVADYTEKSDKHDDATKVVSMNMTNEDIAIIMGSDLVKKQFEAQMEMMKNMPNAEDMGDFDIEKVAQMYKSGAIKMDMPIKMFTTDDGTIVSSSCQGKIIIDPKALGEVLEQELNEDEEPISMDLNMALNIKTMDANKNYNFVYDIVAAENKVVMNLNGDLLLPAQPSENDFYKLFAVMNLKGEGDMAAKMTISSDFLWNGNDGHGITAFVASKGEENYGAFADITSTYGQKGIDSKIALYGRTGTSNSSPELTTDDIKLATLTVNEEYVTPGEFFKNAPVRSEKTHNLLSLNEEKRESLQKELSPKLMELMGKVMGLLPESVLKMLNGEQ